MRRAGLRESPPGCRVPFQGEVVGWWDVMTRMICWWFDSAMLNAMLVNFFGGATKKLELATL